MGFYIYIVTNLRHYVGFENFGLITLLCVTYYAINPVCSQRVQKVRRPETGDRRPETYQAENQPTSKMWRHVSRGTNRTPSSDGQESVSAAARGGWIR